jgi:amino acid permease
MLTEQDDDKESLLQGENYSSSAPIPLELEIDAPSLANDSHSLKQSSWFHSSTIIVGEIMGTGVMGLPAATAKLGWILGLGSVVVFGLFSNYSALLLSKVRNDHYPHAHSYSDLAREIVGLRFSRLTRAAILVNW